MCVDVDADADVVADDADIDVNIGKERVGFGGVRGYADVCVELHYGRGQHHQNPYTHFLHELQSIYSESFSTAETYL